MDSSLALVVAVDRALGIGKAGTIPWRVPADIRHFKRLTRETLEPGLRNAVIMGRKTWESIPVKYRPLDGRLNVVLSRSGDLSEPEDTGDTIVASGLPEALEALDRMPSVARLFIIGGAQVYAHALAHPRCRDIYITRLDQVFECDAKFPAFESDYVLVGQMGEGRSGDIDYVIEHWCRRTVTNCQEGINAVNDNGRGQ